MVRGYTQFFIYRWKTYPQLSIFYTVYCTYVHICNLISTWSSGIRVLQSNESSESLIEALKRAARQAMMVSLRKSSVASGQISTRPHPKWWWSKGNPLFQGNLGSVSALGHLAGGWHLELREIGKSRLVKSYNLARLDAVRLVCFLFVTPSKVLFSNPLLLSYRTGEKSGRG